MLHIHTFPLCTELCAYTIKRSGAEVTAFLRAVSENPACAEVTMPDGAPNAITPTALQVLEM